MANQKIIIKMADQMGRPRRDLRATVVDTDGAAVTFPEFPLGFPADFPARIYDIVGQGTTAPAIVTALQFNVGGGAKQAFVPLASVFNPNSQAKDRVGAAFGETIPLGAAIRLIGIA